MKKSDTTRFRPKVEELERRDTPSTMLPLSDQPVFVVDDDSGEVVAFRLTPPVPFADFSAAADATDEQDESFAVVDYLALEHASVLPTAIFTAGSIKELKDRDEAAASGDEGLLYLMNYTRKSIRNYEQFFGTLPNHDDIVQQVYLEWQQDLPDEDPSEPALQKVFQKDSAEKVQLRKVVRRVLNRERRQMTGREVVDHDMVRLAYNEPAGQDGVDFQIDLDSGVGRISRQEYSILMGRKDNKTFAEIADELEVPTATVHDRYAAVVQRLQALYRPACHAC